jgi:hypothetical protein
LFIILRADDDAQGAVPERLAQLESREIHWEDIVSVAHSIEHGPSEQTRLWPWHFGAGATEKTGVVGQLVVEIPKIEMVAVVIIRKIEAHPFVQGQQPCIS